jgi:hypothetical protein
VTTANPHLRAILIAGVLAMTAAALGFYTLNRQKPSSPADETPIVIPIHHAATAAAKPKPAVKHTAKPVAKPAAKHTATPVAKPTAKPAAAHSASTATKPAVKKHAAAKPAPKPTPVVDRTAVRAALAAGLPKPVAQAFGRSGVVVVSVYSSQAGLDRTSEAEAQTGAALAAAAFVPIDTSKEGASGLLTKAFGLIDPPAVLVFDKPDYKLFVRFDGFTDRDTVRQAAANARPAPTAPAVVTAWATHANAVCRRQSAKVHSLLTSSTAPPLATLKAETANFNGSFAPQILALKPPAAAKAEVAQFKVLVKKEGATATRLVAAVQKKDAAAVGTLSLQGQQVSAELGSLAVQLGATTCASVF